MSTMPAEGSQSPSVELADLSDCMTTSAVTKAKMPSDSTPCLVNAPGHLASSGHGTYANNHVEVQDSTGQLSPPILTTPTIAAGTAAVDRCQGTAHFYRQTTERTAPVSWTRSQPTPHVNGGTAMSRSALDGVVTGRCRCIAAGDEWPVPSTSAAGESSSTASSFPTHQDWRSTNGYHRSEPSHHNGQGSGDDMENYFNANAHMLAYLDLQAGCKESEGESPGGATDGLPGDHHSEVRRQSSSDDTRSLSGFYHNGYGSDDGIIVNGSVSSSGRSQDGLSGHHVKLSTSSEDFIEADISLPLPDMERSIQCSSSEEDLPQLTSLSGSSRYRKRGCYNSDSAQRPCEGPKLIPPASVLNPHSSAVCDYKNGSMTEASRPVSFGLPNRLCTCSVVSYSRRRPLAPSNQSSSDLDADEGVGGMKSSPVEPSPVDSDRGQVCGITVTTSDSSSYFSPEDVDFLDFDVATPHSDNIGELVHVGSNIQDAEECSVDGEGHSHGPPHHAQGGASSCDGDICDECGKREQHCLCASLRVCKRLIEDANALQQKQTTTSVERVLADGSSNCKRLCNVNSRMSDNVVVAAPHCTCCVGRDSGSGSQEHLDTLSCDDQDEDDGLDAQALPPSYHTCSCLYQGCGEHDPNPQHRIRQGSFSCDDTNNLDVEVFSAAPSSDYEDELFNVSRQTSTSNFDQDENAYQDAVEDCASNGFHSACSGSDLESEKSNHIANQPEDCPPEYTAAAELPSGPRPPEIPLPIPARSQDHSPRLPPSLPPSSPAAGTHHMAATLSGCPDCGGAEQPAWMMDSVRLPSPHHGAPPHWADYDLPSDRVDPTQRRHWAVPSWVTDDDDSPTCDPRYGDHQMGNVHGDGGPSYPGSRGVLSGSNDHTPGMRGPVLDGGEDGAEDIQNQTFPDPLPDIFILNLLREKESRAQSACRTQSAVKKVMIWNEYEAYVLQVKQIGVSACGATAVINVLKAFNIYVDKTVASEAIQTNTRAEKAPIAEYLLSRSSAGCTAEHLMTGMETVTSEVTGRFFCFYPEREVDICHWLGTWMDRGAVAVMTLNLQRAVPQGWDVPDAWHHQMVYGVGPKGVYLTNPLEIVPEDVIREQLTSPSELLVQRQDVIARWSADTDLTTLLMQPDARWRQLNVIGQVANILREARRPRVLGFRPQLTPHMRIPAWYRPGITLFVRRGSEVHQQLMNAAPLPLRTVLPVSNPVRNSATTSAISQSPINSLERPLLPRSQVTSGTIHASRSLDEAGMSSSEWSMSSSRLPRHSLDQSMSSSGQDGNRQCSFDQSVSSSGQSANSLDRLVSSSGLSASSSGQFTSGSDQLGSCFTGAGTWCSEPSTCTARQIPDQSPDEEVVSSPEEMPEAEEEFEDSPDGSALDSPQAPPPAESHRRDSGSTR